MGASFDVFVIGGGVAGVTAALSARAGGADVALLRAAPGATAIGGGGWAGPLPPVLARALEDAGLPHVPAPAPLVHPSGERRSYDFAAASHACTLPIDGALIAGIAGLPGVVPPALARLLANEQHLAHATVVIDHTPAAGWSPMSLAAALQKDPLLLAAPLRNAITAGTTHVLLPAVLGLDAVEVTRNAIAGHIGMPVHECLGTPPSIPGWRLDRALIAALRNAGVQIFNGKVMAVGHEKNHITRLNISGDVTAGSAAITIEAYGYILATGKFLGGGISADEHSIIETALDLPVWIEHLDKSFTAPESLTLTSRVRTYDQPLMRAGVHTNRTFQPLDARDRVLFENVVAAGSIRAGSDANQLGLGHAAAEALLAVEHLTQVVRH